MNKKVMIIGAGNTGRGFLARLFQEDGARICFGDQNQALIQKLNAQKEYSIYVGENRKEIRIGDYQAFSIESEEAVSAATATDVIAVSVGNQNLAGLKGFFQKLCEKKPPQSYRVVLFENGISPKTTLRTALRGTEGEKMQITQGVVFCTTIPVKKGELDIVSEDYPEAPVDYDEELFDMEMAHFPMITRFDCLMKRKLYTYNCLSGCIAYLGYRKGYTDYGQAARDPEIEAFCNEIRKKLDCVICKETGVSEEEQREFSAKAMRKFSSRVIQDTIQKNARSASRKVGEGERIMGPMELFLKYGENPDDLCQVAAGALYYMEREEGLHYREKDYEDSVSLMLDAAPMLKKQSLLIEKIKNYLNELRDG